MKQETPTKYGWRRIVKTPTRVEKDIGVLTKGLDFSKNPEKINDQGLAECDGFIAYSGVLKKDWAIIDSANVPCDNITQTAKASVDVCLE